MSRRGKLAFAVARPLLRRRQMTSPLLRRLFSDAHNVTVGLYSYGCFDPVRIAAGTVIGRYCSFAPTSYRFNGNHPIDFLTQHPYLYNPRLGMVSREAIVAPAAPSRTTSGSVTRQSSCRGSRESAAAR